MKRVLPISSLRFVLASIVLLGHVGQPFLRPHQATLALALLRALTDNLFNGPAAVIIFFVISGFCIHYPNRHGLAIRSWRAYFARRYIRILIPMTVAILLAMALRMKWSLFDGSILWSLVCEEIYYLLYPGLITMRDWIGWRNLMIAAWLLWLIVVLTNPGARYYPSYGPALNWALGLPCWLLGCVLAERVENVSALSVSPAQIWTWRGGVWIISVIQSAVCFHTPIGSPWTLNLFAVLGYFWIEREIRFYRGRPEPRLENLGEASYSLYLTHDHGMAVWYLLPWSAGLGLLGAWLGPVSLAAVFSALFYWKVERPSHRLARRVSQHSWFGPAKASVVARGL